jgi:hypothetical protein
MTGDFAKIGAGITLLGGLLTTLVWTGVLERVGRDESLLVSLAFAAVIVAGGLWFLRDHLSNATVKSGLATGCAVLLVAALIAAVFAVLGTYSHSEKPAISAEVSEQLLLTATVKTAGLKSNETVGVRVEGLRRDGAGGGVMLYEAALGPDPSGVVEHSIRLPLAAGLYELVRMRATTDDDYAQCPGDRIDDEQPRKRQLGTGCLVLTLPRLASSPRVFGEWTDLNAQPAISATVRADNVATPIQLRVVAGSDARDVGGAQISPEANGSIDTTLQIPINTDVKRVCAIARWRGNNLPAAESCPPEQDASMSYVLLTRP